MIVRILVSDLTNSLSCFSCICIIINSHCTLSVDVVVLSQKNIKLAGESLRNTYETLTNTDEHLLVSRKFLAKGTLAT